MAETTVSKISVYMGRPALERRYCTADAPMPIEDKGKYQWGHGDAVDVGAFFNCRLYECPHCKLTFHALPPGVD